MHTTEKGTKLWWKHVTSVLTDGWWDERRLQKLHTYQGKLHRTPCLSRLPTYNSKTGAAGRKTLHTHTYIGGISTTDHLNSSPKTIWFQWWNNNEETNDDITGPLVLLRKINSKSKTSQHSILNDASDKVPTHKHVLSANIQSSIFITKICIFSFLH